MAKTLSEFVNGASYITDPSRSEFERRQKEKHIIVTTGYKDRWLDIPNPHYDKAARLADYDHNEDVEVYENFNAGSVSLKDGSKLTLTTEDADILNEVFFKSGLSKDKVQKIKEDLTSSLKNMRMSLDYAKTVKGA